MNDSLPPLPRGRTDSIGRLAELISGDPQARLDADISHVLNRLAGLGARPLELLTPDAARRQPGLGDAVAAILALQGGAPEADGVESEDIEMAGAEGALPARLYRPEGMSGANLPLVLYFHGGGFVTGDLDSHDAAARALARRSGALVLSPAYRLAPEHGFPAAHDDAWALWQDLARKAGALGADPKRLALAGEDAGANLALTMALAAKRKGGAQPLHQLLIHPIAGTDMTTPSYGETLRARPVGLAAMRWRFRHLLGQDQREDDPRLALAARDDLAGLAPTTILLAEIDPLRSEGEALAAALEGAGVSVTCQLYQGMTQGFFGLGQVVTRALFAQSDAGAALAGAFSAQGQLFPPRD